MLWNVGSTLFGWGAAAFGLLLVLLLLLGLLVGAKPADWPVSRWIGHLVLWVAALSSAAFVFALLWPTRLVSSTDQTSFYVALDAHNSAGEPAIDFGVWRQPARRIKWADWELENLRTSVWPPTDRLLRQYYGSRPRPHALQIVVYVHGYANTLNSAVDGTRMIADAWPSPMYTAFVTYRWDSAGSVARYTHDEQAVQTTATSLEWFLESLRAANPDASIVVIAHSMGSRAVLSALEQISSYPYTPIPIGIPNQFGLRSASASPYQQIEGLVVRRRTKPQLLDATILIAPDIRAADFELAIKNHRDAIFAATERMILIGSSNDAVLRMSELWNRTGPRVGQTARASTDTSHVVSFDCDECSAANFGHSYQAAAVRELFKALQSSSAIQQSQ